MAMKVSRTFGIQVVLEKCGCKVQRDYEDASLKVALGDAVYTPCAKHKTKKDSAETIELILGEYLDTKAQEAPTAAPVNATTLGHSVADIATANQSGAASATRIPIKKPGSPSARAGVRRAGGAAQASGQVVSTAVAEARAAGSAASLDAELARAPEPQGGVRLGAVSREKVREVMEEADGEPVTPLDVILGVNDPDGI